MATHSSIFAWRIPQTEEPGGLQSMGLQSIGHNSAANTHTHTCYFEQLAEYKKFSHVQLFATLGLQHHRSPCHQKFPELAKTHVH